MPTMTREFRVHRSNRTLLTGGAMTAAALLSACASHNAATPQMISGKYIAALGDADMAASAFVTGELGTRDASGKDTLTVITLPIKEPETPFGQIEVSNSALGPANAMAVTKDGRYAFVAEYRGHAPAGATSVEQLPKGKSLTAVDLGSPTEPKIVDATAVGMEPSAVAIHPAGGLVAVVTAEPRHQIVMVEFKNGKFSGDPYAWPLLGLDDDGARASSVVWAPDGKSLAITLPERGEVAFYRFKQDPNDELAIRAWGLPVKVGSHPYSGAYTPDGKFLVVNDYKAGGDGDAPGVGMPQGRVSVIKVAAAPADDEPATAKAATHVVTGFANVGVQPIGLAVSHSGKLAATSNLLTSAFPDGDPRAQGAQTRGGSVSLLSISGAGEIRTLGEYPINAVPAGLAFDSEDRFLAVTEFRSFDPSVIDGDIAFFQIQGSGSGASLKQCDFWVGAGKGPHGVLIIR